MSTLRSSAGKYLTRELEKDIDRTIVDVIGNFENLVSYSDMQKILAKLEVVKAIDTTIEKQQSLTDTMWNEFLSTSFELCNIVRHE